MLGFWKAGAASAVVLLCACGGGGGGGGGIGGGGGGGEAAEGLSENQRLFEELTLASNGGSYGLGVGGTISRTSDSASVAFSSVTLFKTALPVSPAGVPGGVDSVFTPPTALIASLPLPPGSENAGSVVLDNGQLLFLPANSSSRYAYVGPDVLIESLTATGQGASAQLIKSHEKVALTGTMATAPQEFRALFGYDANHIDPTATFAAGSAYYKQERYRLGDTVFIHDSDNNPDTNAKSATPKASATTIEQYAATHETAQFWATGTIRTLNGARCWVRNTPDTGSASFIVYCEVAGALYSGSLSVAGTQSSTSYPVGSPTLHFSTMPFIVRLNEAAATSIKSIYR